MLDVPWNEKIVYLRSLWMLCPHPFHCNFRILLDLIWMHEKWYLPILIANILFKKKRANFLFTKFEIDLGIAKTLLNIVMANKFLSLLHKYICMTTIISPSLHVFIDHDNSLVHICLFLFFFNVNFFLPLL